MVDQQSAVLILQSAIDDYKNVCKNIESNSQIAIKDLSNSQNNSQNNSQIDCIRKEAFNE